MNLSKIVALMRAMRIVKSKHTTVVLCGYVRQYKGQIVSNNFTEIIDPHLFAKNSAAASTPEASFIVIFLTQTFPCCHLLHSITGDA